MLEAIERRPANAAKTAMMQHWPLTLGMLALILPSIYDLTRFIWRSSDQGHGPFVLLIVLWLFWTKRQALLALPATASPLGWAAILLACVLNLVGRTQAIFVLEIGAFIPLVMGVTLLNRGWAGVRVLTFPLIFLLFLVPLPASLVDAATGGLKQAASHLAESLLYLLGYPIARSGVMLTIGPYQLLVADACSGMNSMFSLYALYMIYIYLREQAAPLRNAVLLLFVAPIAFLANLVRIISLVLITYYFGDEAGQGFVHGFAGMVLFMVALVSLFGIDKLLGLVLSRRTVR